MIGIYKIENLLNQKVYIGQSVNVERRKYYSEQATNGELSPSAIFSDTEVILLRQRYVNETAREIWKDYKDRITYGSIQKLLCGCSYQHLPIYKKKTKEWINL